MAYVRPQNNTKLSKIEKTKLLEEYILHYQNEVNDRGIKALNVKLPRETFAPTLDALGEFLQNQAECLLLENKELSAFLQENPLPPHMAELLPDKFRVFSLLLNALKQWVSAESAATDRFLLGGTARQTCRDAVSSCIVTGEELGSGAELHHPMRDGRPPILLSKKGHDIVEGTTASMEISDAAITEKQQELWDKLQAIRAKRNQSWVQLREGCRAIVGDSKPCRPGAKSFANKATQETGYTAGDIIELLNTLGK